MRSDRERSPAAPRSFEAEADVSRGLREQDELLAVQESFRRMVAHKLSGTQGQADDIERRATWLVPVQ